jgi:hypothetical protein
MAIDTTLIETMHRMNQFKDRVRVNTMMKNRMRMNPTDMNDIPPATKPRVKPTPMPRAVPMTRDSDFAFVAPREPETVRRANQKD